MYTALIVEPRKHKAFEFVLKNFVKNLDTRWEFVIYHGSSNLEFIVDIITRNPEMKSRKFSLYDLGVDNLTIKQYSDLFYNPKFYDPINTEMFLVFQTDTMISNKNAYKIYEFMHYDYVGAPWLNILDHFDNKEHVIGNGGLSLRRKSKMLYLIDVCKDHCLKNRDLYPELEFEDRFFSYTCNGFYLKDFRINKPITTNAMNFSVESIYYENPFGVHKPWKQLTEEQFNDLSKAFEGLDELRYLNLS